MPHQIIDRGLPQRSKLAFYFPKKGTDNGYYKTVLPFFENIQIVEKKKGHFPKYAPVGRPSNLYAYTGADSRKFSLTFNMTIPHIESAYQVPGYQDTIFVSNSDSPAADQVKFFAPPLNSSKPISQAQKAFTDFLFEIGGGMIQESVKGVLNQDHITDTDKFFYAKNYGLNTDYVALENINNPQSFVMSVQNYLEIADTITATTKRRYMRNKVIDTVLFWINLIRVSNSNNSKNPTFGPPILRLTHGLMYQNIPCICTDWTLRHNESFGYDLQTLMPYQLTFTLSLEELRTGDFSEYQRNSYLKGDNVAGWEAVIEDYGTTDPGVWDKS